jgi:bacteriocin-like protein
MKSKVTKASKKEKAKAPNNQKPAEELSEEQLETVTGGTLTQACASGEHIKKVVIEVL